MSTSLDMLLQFRGGSWELAGSFVGGPIDGLGGGGGGGGLGSRLKLPPNYRLHYTQGLVYVMCNTLQATANKNKNL